MQRTTRVIFFKDIVYGNSAETEQIPKEDNEASNWTGWRGGMEPLGNGLQKVALIKLFFWFLK